MRKATRRLCITQLRWSILVLFLPALSSKDVLPILPIWTPQCAMQPVKQVCVESKVHMEVPIMHGREYNSYFQLHWCIFKICINYGKITQLDLTLLVEKLKCSDNLKFEYSGWECAVKYELIYIVHVRVEYLPLVHISMQCNTSWLHIWLAKQIIRCCECWSRSAVPCS